MLHLIKSYNLTELESAMLAQIVKCYDPEDNICFQKSLTNSEKGIIGSLVKKGLVYDSYNGVDVESNFFPSEEVLDCAG